jgi:ketol-acid reductoisomerase
MDMRYWFKRKYRQIERTLSFLPLIWKGYDWDYRYAIDLFQHQLKRTERSIRENGIHVGNQNTASRIKTAIRLMDKVYDEEYGCEYQDKLKELYGENVSDWWFEDTGKGDDSSYLRYEYEKWDNSEEIKKVERKLLLESKNKQKRAHKLLWDFIEHNIQNWWD